MEAVFNSTSDTKNVLLLAGDFDANGCSELRELFVDISENYVSDLTIDLSGVEFMDSSGVGAIVFLYKRLSSKEIDFELTGASGQPRELLQMLRINAAIPTTFID